MEKIWLISVNMGYGHQRTAFPLRDFAFGGIPIQANDYQEIPKKDRKIWETSRRGYELISGIKRIPYVGDLTFFIFDQFQKILNFYPRRNLSKPNFQLRQTYSFIKKGWGEHLIRKLEKKPLPLVSTFFVPVFMAEHFNYPGEIFCIVCDADISRSWAPFFPEKSRIKYLVPTARTMERLKLYGVRPENIFLTGYPLPLENIGSEKAEVLKYDLENRILNLDIKKRYMQFYEPLIRKHLGYLPKKSDHLLTLMFAVGGAGAQKEIGINIVKSLKDEIKKKKIKIILVAGIRKKVNEYFERGLRSLRLGSCKNIEIIFDEKIEDYFRLFNQALRKTDILWTKPSELSFYSALGLPIIIAPSVGSQEEFNKRWLLKSGFGLLQENPKYVRQWLFDWLKNGYLAEAALQGFIEGEKSGVLNIKKVIEKCSG